MKNLLIFSFSEDPHVISVCSHLDEIEARYFLINTNEIHEKYTFQLNPNNSEYTIKDKSNKREIYLDDSWNIWNRRILDLDLSKQIPRGLAKVINDETKRMIEGVMFSHKGKVINDPRNNYKARNKIDQINFAAQIAGVIVPETIISNNPNQIRDFYKKNKGKICFKLQKGAIVDIEDKKFTVLTNLVEEEHLRDRELLSQCPHLFQEYIDKNYEVRVTCIGNEVIGTAIHSQDSEISKVDYRRYDFNVPYKNINVPDNIKKFCNSMLKHYGLYFGAFDFIVNSEEEYIFLELNPNGQWLWLEQLGGSKISKALAKYLVS